ncbi:hypothetical protein M758_1G253700 [Ceratodon purpureus]|nr:hypothetical protein M758_1G253700 [Ceratodon purpureus]
MRTVIVHLETVAAPLKERYGPDFRKMNKAAAIHHYCRSNEQRAARERFYYHLQPKNQLNTKWKLPSDNNPNHRYGLSHPSDVNFSMLVGNGYGDEWIDMNQYFASKYPERYTEAPSRMEVITNKATEMSKHFIRSRINRPPPKKRFILSRFQNVPKRIDNENQTPLNRSPPFHKFYGIPGQNRPPCGIHKI